MKNVSSKQSNPMDGIAALLRDPRHGLSEPDLERVLQKLEHKINYVPRVGIFGKTGAGKSSLCNGLFGQDLCAVSHVESCTREQQAVTLQLGASRGIELIDVPGVGENCDRDAEYAALYAELLPSLDLILWVLKADERAYSVDIDFYQEMVRPYLQERSIPFVVVLNQVDKIEPLRQWDEAACQPGKDQQENIRRKMNVVTDVFDLSIDQVVAVSAVERFGLSALIDRIVDRLPRDQIPAFVREVRRESVSEHTMEKTRQSVLGMVYDTVREYARDAVDRVVDTFRSATSWIRSWF